MTDQTIGPIRPLGAPRMNADRTTLLCDYCEDGKAEVFYLIDRQPEDRPPDEWHTLCGACADVRIAHLNHSAATGVQYEVDDYIVEDLTFPIEALREKLLKGDGLKDGWLASWLGQQGLQAVLNFDGSWIPPDDFAMPNG